MAYEDTGRGQPKFPWRSGLFLCYLDFLEDSMAFYLDVANNSRREEVKLIIFKQGGYIADDYSEDPYTIILTDGTSKNNVPDCDRFDIKFVTDSAAGKKLKNLNQYLTGESLFQPYDANQILYRKLKWSAVKRKITSSSTLIDKDKSSSSELKNGEIGNGESSESADEEEIVNVEASESAREVEIGNVETSDSEEEENNQNLSPEKPKPSVSTGRGKEKGKSTKSTDKNEEENDSESTTEDEEENSSESDVVKRFLRSNIENRGKKSPASSFKEKEKESSKLKVKDNDKSGSTVKTKEQETSRKSSLRKRPIGPVTSSPMKNRKTRSIAIEVDGERTIELKGRDKKERSSARSSSEANFKNKERDSTASNFKNKEKDSSASNFKNKERDSSASNFKNKERDSSASNFKNKERDSSASNFKSKEKDSSKSTVMKRNDQCVDSAVEAKQKETSTGLAVKNRPICPSTSTSTARVSRTTRWVRQIVPEDTSSVATVLMASGNKTKGRLPSESPPGSPVSDFSVDLDEDVSIVQSNANTTTASKLSKIRREYTDGNRQKIVDYIVHKKWYKYTRGNLIWKQMEKEKVLPERTYQSMKEHFRKKILPDLTKYGLSKSELQKFKDAERFLSKCKRVATAPI